MSLFSPGGGSPFYELDYALWSSWLQCTQYLCALSLFPYSSHLLTGIEGALALEGSFPGNLVGPCFWTWIQLFSCRITWLPSETIGLQRLQSIMWRHGAMGGRAAYLLLILGMGVWLCFPPSADSLWMLESSCQKFCGCQYSHIRGTV